MRATVVIPCLNEEPLIKRTARSLGFGCGAEATPPDANLVLIDNGSTDGTLSILGEIAECSRPGSVLIECEPERGYVPARHRGALVAAQSARADRISDADVLLIQADADTIYEKGYVEAMRRAGAAAGAGVLLEGTTHPPHRFLHDHPGYERMADQLDDAILLYCVPTALDVIVDDKIAALSLATYQSWGGHRREFNAQGTELLAETSRLFLRGKALGGMRERVAGAVAAPSRRKIFQNPVRHFVTAGFPRENAWWVSWNARYQGPRKLAEFEAADGSELIEPAVSARIAHLIILFAVLPRAVARVLGSGDELPTAPAVIASAALDLVPAATELASGSTAPLFERAFQILDQRTAEFRTLI